MSFRVTSGGGMPEIDEGIYDAKLVEYTPKKSEWQGQIRDQWQMKFLILDEDYPDVTLFYWVNRKIDEDGNDIVHTKSNFYAVLKALNGGEELSAGDSGDLADYVGATCRVDVQIKEKADGSEIPHIKEVRGPRKVKVKATTAKGKKSEVVDEEDE